MLGQLFMLLATGVCLVLAALANPIVLPAYLGLSGPLPHSLAAVLWALDAGLIALAGILIYFRKDVRALVNVALIFGEVTFGLLLVEGILRLIDRNEASRSRRPLRGGTPSS